MVNPSCVTPPSPPAAREIVAFERTRARDVEKEEDDDVSTNNSRDDDDDDDDQRKKNKERLNDTANDRFARTHASLLRRRPRSWSSAAAVRQRPLGERQRASSQHSRAVWWCCFESGHTKGERFWRIVFFE